MKINRRTAIAVIASLPMTAFADDLDVAKAQLELKKLKSKDRDIVAPIKPPITTTPIKQYLYIYTQPNCGPCNKLKNDEPIFLKNGFRLVFTSTPSWYKGGFPGIHWHGASRVVEGYSNFDDFKSSYKAMPKIRKLKPINTIALPPAPYKPFKGSITRHLILGHGQNVAGLSIHAQILLHNELHRHEV